MSKHTPGRWFDSDNYVFSDNELVENNPTVVCRAATVEDARLIAAAPDMLAVLEELDNTDSAMRDWDAVRAVIAKAKGEL